MKRDRVLIILLTIIVCTACVLPYLIAHSNSWSSATYDNWGTFGDYIGGILGTIIALISAFLIYKTYARQYESTRLQQFDTTFFNLLETFRLSVDRLHRRNDDLKWQYFGNGAIDSMDKSLVAKDFFDILYSILHRYYKSNLKENTVKGRVNNFFKDHYWQIGHYVRNFISVIEYVHNSNASDKKFYVSILRDMATIDELRLLFYTTMWKLDSEGITWKKLFDEYDIFLFLGNDKNDKKLIDPSFDWSAYLEIDGN